MTAIFIIFGFFFFQLRCSVSHSTVEQVTEERRREIIHGDSAFLGTSLPLPLSPGTPVPASPVIPARESAWGEGLATWGTLFHKLVCV